MIKLHIKIETASDLLKINRIMVEYDNLNFDIKRGNIVLDGKSLLGLCLTDNVEFDLIVYGEQSSINDFLPRISEYTVSCTDIEN